MSRTQPAELSQGHDMQRLALLTLCAVTDLALSDRLAWIDAGVEDGDYHSATIVVGVTLQSGTYSSSLPRGTSVIWRRVSD